MMSSPRWRRAAVVSLGSAVFAGMCCSSQVSVCARRGQVRDEGLSDAGRGPVETVVCVDDVAIADPPGEAGGHLEALVGVRARPVLRNLATTTSGSVVSCQMY
jgi:hypothetical protein